MLFNRFTYFNLFLLLLLSFSINAQAKTNPYVLVSVAPHRFFVERIAGNTVDIGLMVPAGASAHTYEPTPKQMINASKAAIWFRIGEPFEMKALQALKSHNPSLMIVDLRKGLDLIRDDHHSAHCSCSGAEDLHFWLSTRLAHIQANTIADALIHTYPENEQLYRDNLKNFHDELSKLDQDIQQILASIPNHNILVSHPAYAYFCRDYQLRQFSIECEGKDPSPQQLNKILNLARQLNIRTIFVQKQYSSKGARLIAEEIGAQVVNLDPYSEDYISSMLEIARAFSRG